MSDWEPYHQDERDMAVEKGGYLSMLLLCFFVMLLIVALVLYAPDIELHPLPSPQPFELRD